MSLGFPRSDSPVASPKEDRTDASNAVTHTQTIYSAQSSGEYNFPAIHYAIDFEGWLNGRLGEMYQVGSIARMRVHLCAAIRPFLTAQMAPQETFPDIIWELNAVDNLLACTPEEAVKYVMLFIFKELQRSEQPGTNPKQDPSECLPLEEWFGELQEQIVEFQENCREALLDDKIRACNASLDSSFKRMYHEGQLRLNRAKAKARPANANRRMSDPNRLSA